MQIKNTLLDIWVFLGRLHPLAVHFPVALIVLAAVLELFTLRNFNSPLRSTIRVSVIAGAVSAVVSVCLGLLLARDGNDYDVDMLSRHQWMGITAAILALFPLFIIYKTGSAPSSVRIKTFRATLFITTLGISVAGHFGSMLTHGQDYLISALESSNEPVVKVDFALLTSDTARLTPKQEMDLNIEVKAVFAHNCYKCHSAEKIKGDLRLDNKRMIFRGGKSGPLFVAGHPSESEIIRRLTLPRSDSDAMPPKGKKISDDDIKTLSFWIQKGAPWPDQSANEKTFRIARLSHAIPHYPRMFSISEIR